MASLLFKLEYTVRELMIPPKDILTFTYRGPHEVKVVLRAPSTEEQASGHSASNAFCTARSSVEPNEKVGDVFAKIAANQIISAEDDSKHVKMEYPAPDGTRIRLPGLARFPVHFRSFIESVSGELADYAARTISVLRWRANELGPHNPVSTRGLYWSVDGSFWHPAPHSFRVLSEVHGTLRASEQLRIEVENIVSAGGRSPLHHDLFREAWEQRHNNPRSAIVIGMAAAELSVKHCISSLVPDAEWLVTNLPTPPLARMLIDYLPRLPVRWKIDGKVKPPPAAVLESLKKGVTIRNQLSHAGASSPSIEDVEEILRAVQDVLWLVDYYSGSQWALGFLRAKTNAELSAL
jgi:hypothetical protein